MLLEQLIGNLRLQIENHELLLESMETETNLPANCGVDKLEKTQQLRDKMVIQIRKLELERLDITRLYCKENQLAKPVSLKIIIDHCSRDKQKVLQQQREQLTILIQKITEVGKLNASQANARIACFSEIQSAVNKALKRSPTYSFYGMIKKPKGACLMQKSV
ncbi:MAG: hypothetical protein HOD92_24225 [Deltaproteobacteria bacterium]|jgi:hypothetical protein|nr:hypothetical protein [Deltaproteobacteria bacterium]MBT4527878.1 hypothetical protein [Deltaproteobacteria bacterium]